MAHFRRVEIARNPTSFDTSRSSRVNRFIPYRIQLRQIDFLRITRGNCLDFPSLIIVRKVIA
jgi:hypothetical protein